MNAALGRVLQARDDYGGGVASIAAVERVRNLIEAHRGRKEPT